MQINLKTNKSIISSWLLGTMCVAVISATTISFLFQDNIDENLSYAKHILFKKNDFNQFNKITIKNQIGTFILDKNADTNDEWYLVEPRAFPANPITLENIRESLERISVLKTLKKDDINISHYSLSNPSVELDFQTTSNETIQLKFGIMNPIDNSTYITHSKYNEIFQITTLIFNFEGLILGDFIDAKIISSNRENIASLALYRGDQKLNNLVFQIEKNENDNWIIKNRSDFNQDKIQSIISKFYDLKGQMILDKISEDAQKLVTQYLNSPLFSLELRDNQGKKITYIITNIIDSLPNVKVEKRSAFLVKASNRKHAYLVSKDHLDAFSL